MVTVHLRSSFGKFYVVALKPESQREIIKKLTLVRFPIVSLVMVLRLILELVSHVLVDTAMEPSTVNLALQDLIADLERKTFLDAAARTMDLSLKEVQ